MFGWLFGGAGLVGGLGLRGQGGALVAAILEVGGWRVFFFACGELAGHAFGAYAGVEPFGIGRNVSRELVVLLTGLEGSMILTRCG